MESTKSELQTMHHSMASTENDGHMHGENMTV